jgi:O-antigen/teichoic acid export membrane protein
MKQKLLTELLVIAGLVLLPLALYWDVTVGGRTMLPADNLFRWPPWQAAAAEFGVTIPHNELIGDLIIQNYAWKRFVLHSLGQGEIPLWNPYLFAGAPFLANGQHSALYPFSILFLILPLSKAYGWFALIQLWLAGISMYLFGRVLGMRRGSAMLAGLVYQGCGFMVISAAVFPMISAAVVWLPFLLACVEEIVAGEQRSRGAEEQRRTHRSQSTAYNSQSRRVLWVALGSVALGMQILAGHPEFTYYTLLIIGLYAAWRLAGVVLAGRRERAFSWGRFIVRPALWLAAMVALGLMLAAVQLVPLFEVGQVNFRQGGTSFAELQGWAFPNRRVVAFLLPNFFGNPAHHAYRDVFNGEQAAFERNYYGELNPHGPNSSSWGIKNYVEGAAYLGILPLLLAIIGTVAGLQQRERRGLTIFFVLLALASLAFIFGTPLYALLYYGLPFFDQLHTPFRWVFPLSLCVAVLAGLGADVASRGAEEQRSGREEESRKPAVGSRRSALGWAAVLAGTAVLLGLGMSRLFYGRLESLVERLFLGLAQAADAFPSVQAFYSYTFWQVLIFGLVLLASGVVLLLARRRPWWIVIALALVAVDLYLTSANFHTAADPALLAYRPAAVQWLEEQPGLWRLTSFDPKGTKVLNANTPWLSDLQDVRGYDSIISRQYAAFMEAIEPQNGLLANRIQPVGSLEALNSPLLDVLGVKYVVTTESLDLPKLQLAWEGEGVRIYENLAVAPRAYTLPQTAMAVVEEPLAAMRELDPRHHVLLTAEEQIVNCQLSSINCQLDTPQSAELEPAAVEAYGLSEVIASVAVEEPSWLVLNDSYFPGWRAFARPVGGAESDEQEVPIHRVNGNFRGVMLPEGEWTVRFRYSPRSFQLGGLTSAMGVFVLIFALAVWGWRRFYQPVGGLSLTGSVAKNSALPMALNLFNKGIDFVFAAYYLRVLGPADAGSFATAIAVAGIFEILANFGLNLLLIREVSQDKSQASRYLLNTSLLRVATTAVAFLPILVYVWSTFQTANPLSPAEVTAILLMMAGMIFSGLALGITGLFYVYEEAEIPAAMSTATTMLKVGFGVVVLLLGYSFVGLAAVSIVVNFITLAALAVIAFRRFPLSGPWQVDIGLQRDMVQKGFPLMLIHLLQTIFISVDVILLRQLLPNGEEVVGWYNSAYKWFNALQVIPAYFTLALFPIISREIANNMASAARMYRLALKLMLLLALPIAATMTFAANFLIGVLGGAEYLPHGAIALQVIIWAIPFGWLNSVTNYVLVALGLEARQPRAFVLAVGFNVIANWLFIPRIPSPYGYVAAAVITILSEVVLLVIFEHYRRQRMPEMEWGRLAGRPLLLAAIMLGAMWLGTQLHLLVGLVIGVMVYLSGLWLLRIVGEEELVVLRRILPGSVAARFRQATTADR